VQAFLNFSFGAVPVAIRCAHQQLMRAAPGGSAPGLQRAPVCCRWRLRRSRNHREHQRFFRWRASVLSESEKRDVARRAGCNVAERGGCV